MTETQNTTQRNGSQDTPFRKSPSPPPRTWTITSAAAFVESEEAVENGALRGSALHYLIDALPAATGDDRAQILRTISIAKGKKRFLSKSVCQRIDTIPELKAVVASISQST